MATYLLNVLCVRQPKIVMCSVINYIERNVTDQKKFNTFYGVEILIIYLYKHSHFSVC